MRMISPYALLDSGAGQRLERFGEKTLLRPSSLAVWKQRNPKLWQTYDVAYDHDHGWSFTSESFESWRIELAEATLTLRLQRNGQIGFFPEHSSYLSDIVAAVRKQPSASVLNLFAYTGMASVTAARAGAVVTHVDNLKSALDWARTNAEANALPKESLRLIPEEALTFLEREIKRGKSYEIIILDPPGFSRLSKTKTWDLSEILPRLAEMIASLLAPGGELFFTAHGSEAGSVTIENLLADLLPNARCESRQLVIPELASDQHQTKVLRKLPAGFLVHCKN